MLKIAIFALLIVSINCRSWTTTTTTTQPSVVFTPSASSATDFCYNGGTSALSGLSYVCRCPYGYTGSRCESMVDACTGVQCTNAVCQAENSNEFTCSYSYYYNSYGDQAPPYTLQPSSCDAYNLCQNGGKCNLGYTNNNTLVFGCYCPSGYTGLRCEQQYAYGVQPESSNYYYYSSNDHVSQKGQSFLLLNSEITQKSNISQIKFYAQQEGEFVFTFVKLSGCGDAGQPSCAQLVSNQFQQNAQNGRWTLLNSNLKSQLEQARTTSSYSVSVDYAGFKTIDLPGGFQAAAGTLVALTQVDGVIGHPHAFTTNQYSDLYIDVDALDVMSLSQLNLTCSYNSYVYYAQSQNQTVTPSQWALPVMLVDSSRIITSSPTSSSNQCSNAICLNGGTCNWVAAQSTYTCSCPTGVTGQHCEYA